MCVCVCYRLSDGLGSSDLSPLEVARVLLQGLSQVSRGQGSITHIAIATHTNYRDINITNDSPLRQSHPEPSER